MKLKVIFREYELPEIDPETQEKERGEFLGSFNEIIEGETPIAILEIAHERATRYSSENGTDVRVWETEVTVTPRGILSY